MVVTSWYFPTLLLVANKTNFAKTKLWNPIWISGSLLRGKGRRGMTVGWSCCSKYCFSNIVRCWNGSKKSTRRSCCLQFVIKTNPKIKNVEKGLIVLKSRALPDIAFSSSALWNLLLFACTCVNFLVYELNIPKGINRAIVYLIFLILVPDVCSLVSHSYSVADNITTVVLRFCHRWWFGSSFHSSIYKKVCLPILCFNI